MIYTDRESKREEEQRDIETAEIAN